MDEKNDSHQLNGYKYSFSRVNPYLAKPIQSLLTHRNAPSDLNHTSQRQTILKQPQSHSKSQINQLQRNSFKNTPLTSEKLKPLHFKHLKQLPIPIHTNTINNIERLLYRKFQQNEKNKALIALYLKNNKIKINLSKKVPKNKLNHIKCHDNISKTQKNNHNLILGQDKQLTFPLIPYPKYTTKHSTQQKHQKLLKTHRHSSTSHHSNIQHEEKDKQNYLLIIESSEPDSNNNQPPNNSNSNSIKRRQRTITQPTKKKCKNEGNHLKLLRNFSELKFLAYLPPTRQYAKIKHSSSQTAPVNRFSQLTLSSQALQNDKKAEVRKSIGALKYKSPRVMISSRNRKILSRKQVGPKMKLFTEQEQNSIIKEFYSQEKNQQ